VSQDLLGKWIVYDSPGGRLSARIVEVEAYVGQDDPACHASAGKTARTELMFGRGGFAYIYFIYGMYHCFNFVTEREGRAAAVLLRAAEPMEGLQIMQDLSPGQSPQKILAGPGKFCRSFGLTREQNGTDLTGGAIWLEDHKDDPVRVHSTPRIGIKKAVEHPWRFYDADSKSVSKPPAAFRK
jgi:DNA-3-methyladenine glycosylase